MKDIYIVGFITLMLVCGKLLLNFGYSWLMCFVLLLVWFGLCFVVALIKAIKGQKND